MKRELHPCIYIMTNKYNKVLYTGVTSNLLRRVTEHKEKTDEGFTSRYNLTKLVYYEEYATKSKNFFTTEKTREKLCALCELTPIDKTKKESPRCYKLDRHLVSKGVCFVFNCIRS